MAVAVKIGDDKVVLAQYLAAQDAFDKNLKKFESTFKSIKPVSGSSSSTPAAEDTAQAYQKCLDTDGTTLEFCQGKYPNSAAEADAKLSPEDLATRQKAQDLADKLRALAGQ
jgi:hypothetical protein